jgi:zinc transporter 1/2/3
VSTITYFDEVPDPLCRSYNINGSSSVLPVGVLDAVSAGILLYIGIHLLMQDVGRPTSLDMSADPSLQWIYGQLAQGKTLHIAVALAALILGLFCMSLLGKWA